MDTPTDLNLITVNVLFIPYFFDLNFVVFFSAFILKCLVEWQTVKTLIRLLQEQSDLGLHICI